MKEIWGDSRLSVTSDVSWAIERIGVRVFRVGQAPVLVQYPEAAIWDLAESSAPLEPAVDLLAVINRSSREEAERLLRDTTQLWLELGYWTRLLP